MGTFFNRKNGTIICIVFSILFVVLLAFQHLYSSYRIQKNLMAYQSATMETTIKNLIVEIDNLRAALKEHWNLVGTAYTEEDVKHEIENYLRRKIYNMEYPTGSYLWVNEVKNYSGGDDYAIRLIHANLRDTEGILLSTNTKDVKGALPYLEELEGVKENGSILYSYYFKEYNSTEISKKLTYARLYAPYNWIICVGTYYNSLYMYAGGLSTKENTLFTVGYFVLFCLMIFVLIYVIVQAQLHSVHLLQENERLHDEVGTDALTGAENRTAGNQSLQQVIDNLESNPDTSIAMFDIDNFKVINDRYGHNIGDMVIQSLSGMVMESLNSDEKLIRWGADEFIIVYNRSKHDINKVLNTLNKNAREMKFSSEDGKIFNITISVGASYIHEEDKTISDLVKRIDDAVYLAKREKDTFAFLM